MTNNITTIGEPKKPILTCTYCTLDTAGNHSCDCPMINLPMVSPVMDLNINIKVKLTQTNESRKRKNPR